MTKFLCLGGPLHYRFVDHLGTVIHHDNNITYIWSQGAFVLEGYTPCLCDLQAATVLGLTWFGTRLCVGGELHGQWKRGVPEGYKKVLNSSGQHIGCVAKRIELVDIDDWEIYLGLMEKSTG